ncbi:hypothetical protein SAMN05444380_101134 [Thermophagus xiamenensis]|jgi:hypothetical protein|uniref:Uncharacterized protein n=1 Tax=Thermophagus xiamenensis TaxID=385682 RepID=A0A1I1UT82_9BACT|nr:hypothetical protein SAMN05444380_101134 [Thermophagus xiamenensis]
MIYKSKAIEIAVVEAIRSVKIKNLEELMLGLNFYCLPLSLFISFRC